MAILLLSLVYINAIEIQLSPDKKIDVSQEDLMNYKNYMKQKYNYIITDNKGAKKLIRENRILANEFLKNQQYLRKNRNYIKIMLEDYLADKYVQNIQHSIKIPKKVLYSYYLDNKEKFKKKPKVKIERFRFSSYDKAMKFYQEARNISTPKIIETKAIQYGAQKKDYGWKSAASLKKRFLSFIKKNKKDYLTPPFVYTANSVNVYYIKDYRSGEGYLPFEKVKKQIEKILYNQTFEKVREDILKRYEK